MYCKANIYNQGVDFVQESRDTAMIPFIDVLPQMYVNVLSTYFSNPLSLDIKGQSSYCGLQVHSHIFVSISSFLKSGTKKKTTVKTVQI